ncbi:MAG: formylglycine-generating enzyme family protein [Candidatus Cloacimonetes bacterium]|nr:formylglycine-generating enzyme family protein [Candidatus Cloacimonadota bacterium]
MRNFVLIAISLLLLSCSEPLTRNNPYDTHYDLPEPDNMQIEHVSLTTKKLSWAYDIDNIEGFKVSRRENGTWLEDVLVAADQRTYTEENVPINENIQYKVIAFAGDNHSDGVETTIFSALPTPYNLELSIDSANIILTWDYELDGIGGYRVEKREISGDWVLYADNISAELREWEDDSCNYLDSYRIKAYYQEYESFSSNEVININPDWCIVPAGDFTWGEDDEIQTINYDYEIMKYDVTNFQYVAYLEDAYVFSIITVSSSSVAGYYDGDENYVAGEYEYYDLDGGENRINWDGSNFNIEEGFNDHPVVEVSWFGANAYAEYYGWRLPTEEEWEKAARGNTGNEYPWGDIISGDRANYYNSGDPWDNGTTPICFYNGQFYEGFQTSDSPSPYGCYDMCGNVYNWTDSWYSGTSTYRVLHGGSFYYNSSYDYLRSWYRSFYGPSGTDCGCGFRCARTLM